MYLLVCLYSCISVLGCVIIFVCIYFLSYLHVIFFLYILCGADCFSLALLISVSSAFLFLSLVISYPCQFSYSRRASKRENMGAIILC